MSFGAVQIIPFMHNSLCKPAFWQEMEDWIAKGSGNLICYMVLCYALLIVTEKGVESNYTQSHVFSVVINSKVTLAIQDVEDKVLWKAIYVLLWAEFPTLKALQFCNSTTPAVDKIYYLTNDEKYLDLLVVLAFSVAIRIWMNYLVPTVKVQMTAGMSILFSFIFLFLSKKLN